MRTRFYKLFWMWELEKEEAWINDMASHGYGLVCPHRTCFDFEEVAPGSCCYKHLFLKGSRYSPKVQEYMKFLDEMGVKEVGSLWYLGHTLVYLRYDKTNEPFELYSDLDSKIEYEKVMMSFLWIIVILNLCAWFFNFLIVMSSFMTGNPSLINMLGFLNLGIAAACFIGILKKDRKIRAYKAEREIHE